MFMLLRAVNRFNAIPTKISVVSFTEIEQMILKFVQNHKRRQIATEILRLKNKAGIMLLDFKPYYKTIKGLKSNRDLLNSILPPLSSRLTMAHRTGAQEP